jgi:ketosteroid isomerase-like protein
VTSRAFSDWLARYGRAWEERDPDLVMGLFTEDARFFRTPWAEPQHGRSGIAEAWVMATMRQEQIRFASEVLAMEGDRAIAHFEVELLRLPERRAVQLDGVLVATMNPSGQCRELHEWWMERDRP